MTYIRDFFKYSPLIRPFRALGIAYGYVLRGEKVITPIKWSNI